MGWTFRQQYRMLPGFTTVLTTIPSAHPSAVASVILERVHTHELSAEARRELLLLCAEAYEEDLTPYLEWIGDGLHLIGREASAMVSHLMIVERALQPAQAPVLRTGYIELVATPPRWQGRGYASRLLREAITDLTHFELAALSPSDEAFYARLGWERWRGPLSVRRGNTVEPTLDEEIMVRRTPSTPPWLTLDMPLSCEWREGEIW